MAVVNRWMSCQTAKRGAHTLKGIVSAKTKHLDTSTVSLSLLDILYKNCTHSCVAMASADMTSAYLHHQLVSNCLQA